MHFTWPGVEALLASEWTDFSNETLLKAYLFICMDLPTAETLTDISSVGSNSLRSKVAQTAHAQIVIISGTRGMCTCRPLVTDF